MANCGWFPGTLWQPPPLWSYTQWYPAAAPDLTRTSAYGAAPSPSRSRSRSPEKAAPEPAPRAARTALERKWEEAARDSELRMWRKKRGPRGKTVITLAPPERPRR